MATLKTIAREQLLEPVVMRLRRVYSATYKFRGGYYRAIRLTPSEIRDGSYKQYLGGGRDAWELRGAFQLFFLKQMGLQPFHKFLDVGCGPLRGGAHLIGYLDQGQYFGVDYNRDFIQAARQIVEDKKLSHKKPTLQTLCDFGFTSVGGDFVFALAFSVLNHCHRSQRKRFFEQVPACLERNARLYITHARWFGSRQSLCPAKFAALSRTNQSQIVMVWEPMSSTTLHVPSLTAHCVHPVVEEDPVSVDPRRCARTRLAGYAAD